MENQTKKTEIEIRLESQRKFTQIELYSEDGSVNLGEISLIEFITQMEYYFNSFGHLPPIGSLATQDRNSVDTQSEVHIQKYQYGGIVGDNYVIYVDLSTLVPGQLVKKVKSK